MKFELVTKYNDEEIRHDMTNDITKMATTQIMMLKDKHTRQALIDLGWTPPNEHHCKPESIPDSISVAKNIREIIIEWLKENKYEGLCNPDVECGCLIADFMPCCESAIGECFPAYKQIYDPEKCFDCESGECDKEKYSWCMFINPKHNIPR